MAFGDIVLSNNGHDNELATHTATLGGTATSGNLLVAGFSNGSSGGVIDTPPPGWTYISGYGAGEVTGNWHWYFKISDGTETNATLIWTAIARGGWFIIEYEWGEGPPVVTSNEDETNVATDVDVQNSGALTPGTSHNIMCAMHGCDRSTYNYIGQAIDGSWREDTYFIGVSSSYAYVKVSSLVDAAVASQEAQHTDTTGIGSSMYGAIVSFDVNASSAATINTVSSSENGDDTVTALGVLTVTVGTGEATAITGVTAGGVACTSITNNGDDEVYCTAPVEFGVTFGSAADVVVNNGTDSAGYSVTTHVPAGTTETDFTTNAAGLDPDSPFFGVTEYDGILSGFSAVFDTQSTPSGSDSPVTISMSGDGVFSGFVGITEQHGFGVRVYDASGNLHVTLWTIYVNPASDTTSSSNNLTNVIMSNLIGKLIS